MLLRQKFDQQYRPDDIQDKKQQILFVLVLILFPISVVWFTSSLDYRANLFPITLSLMSLSLLTLILAVKAIDYYKIAFRKSALVRFLDIRIFEKNKGIDHIFKVFEKIDQMGNINSLKIIGGSEKENQNKLIKKQ